MPGLELNFPNPIETRSDLFGRDAQLTLIQETLRSHVRRAAVIMGERVMGKTSLLNVAIEWASREGQLRVLQLPHANSRDALIEEILDGMAAEANTSLHRLGLRDANGRLQLSVTEFGRVAAQLTGAADAGVLLCLDELDSLLINCPDDASANQILDFILHVIAQTSLPVKFLVTVTRTTPQIMRSYASPFLSAARMVYLAPWPCAEVREFVDWLVQGRFNCTDAAYDLLCAAGGGHPYLTKAILHGLLRDRPDSMGQLVTDEEVRAATDAAVMAPEVDFTLDNIVGVHFTPDEQRLLWQLAVSPVVVRVSDQAADAARVHELVQRQYLRVGEDGRIEHTFGLLRDWLRRKPWAHRWAVSALPEVADTEELGPPLFIDESRKLVFLGEHELKVTAQEYRFLSFLVAHAGAVVDRYTVATEVWPDEEVPDGVREGRLDALVYRLREELGAVASRYIETRRGRGYYVSPQLVRRIPGGHP